MGLVQNRLTPCALVMPVLRNRRVPIGRCASVALLGLCALSASAGTSAATSACPDVSGRYGVTGLNFGHLRSAIGDALAAMHGRDAGYLEGGIELSGAADGTLLVSTRSSRLVPWPSRPDTVLRAGTDFECSGGRLLFARSGAKATRKTEEGKWYEGEAATSISRLANGELSIAVRFTGSERITLYSYESANVSVPKPGTGTKLTDTFRWPVYSDADPLAPTTPVVADSVRDTRQRLTSQVLGNVVIAGLEPERNGTLANLTLSRSDDVVAFEDRLRAAAIVYETRGAPAWWNNAYHMQLLIRPAGTLAVAGLGPSAFRIEHELQRTLPAMANIDSVVAVEDGYVVKLTLGDSTPIADVIRRVQLNSSLIEPMQLLDESAIAGSRNRIARLKVRSR